MREITWLEAIEIAVRRRDHDRFRPVLVIFNGKRGDFDSLRSLGLIGQMEQDENGVWYVNTAYSHYYLLDNSTVWVG